MKYNWFFTLSFLILIGVIAPNTALSGQNITWNWATEFSSRIIFLEDLAIDDQKNSYATGHFWQENFYVDGEPMSNDSGFIFLVKLDSFGDLQWVKTVPEGPFNGGYTVDCANGFVYLGIRAENKIVLGEDTIPHIPGAGTTPVILKLDQDGNVVDHALFSSVQTALHDVTIAPNGDLIVSGLMVRGMNIGTDSLNFTGESAAFLVRLNPDLEPIWMRKIDSDNQRCELVKCVSDREGNVVCILQYFTNAIFGTDTLRPKFNDIGDAVVQYSSDGELLWVYSVEGSVGTRHLHELDSDAKGNIYVVGSVEGNVIHEDTLASENWSDYYVLKLNPSGRREWDFMGGGFLKQTFNQVHVGSDGFYVAGGCYEQCTFPDTTIRSNSDAMNFIAKYSIDGEFKWVYTTNSTGGGTPKGFAQSGNQIWTAGGFNGLMVLGPDTMGTHPTFYNGYLAQFTDLDIPLPQEPPSSPPLGIFPNPVANTLTCNFFQPNAGQVKLSFWDTSGRLVRVFSEENIDKGMQSLQLDVSGMSEGLYFLKIDGEQIHQTSKLLVRR
jgi:hypothetical protein